MNLQRQMARSLNDGLKNLAIHVQKALRVYTGDAHTPVLLIAHIRGTAHYIASVDRATGIAILKEQLARLEAEPIPTDHPARGPATH